MSKPVEIPQDVWDASEMLAMQFVEWLTPTPTDPDTEYVFAQSIARAIISEREACATIVSTKAARLNPGWVKVSLESAAAAIRKRGEVNTAHNNKIVEV